MNTTTSNKLIAEFMGWKKEKGLYHIPKDVGYFATLYHTDLYFHCSFDWMMPVVEKIEKMDETKTVLPRFEINSHYAQFWVTGAKNPITAGCYKTSPNKISFATKREAVYYVAVKAIELYNKRKKS